MSGGSSITLLSALLALLLLWAAATDLRARTISNRLNASIALLAPLWWWASGLSFYPDIVFQIGLALAVFGFFAGMFALGVMGGGDVKMIGALALWLPLTALADLLIIMALIGGGVTLVTLLHHRVAHKSGTPEIPYGIAISLAGLWVIGEPYFNHLAG